MRSGRHLTLVSSSMCDEAVEGTPSQQVALLSGFLTSSEAPFTIRHSKETTADDMLELVVGREQCRAIRDYKMR